jgi:threonine dehydrogenase-like Zn-dependent dehydrogenase
MWTVVTPPGKGIYNMQTLIVDSQGQLGMIEVPMPKYNDHQALVKVLSCGICNGTDTKLIHQTFKGFSLEDYPLMLGHEAVGQVVEMGKTVTGLAIGDLVLLPFNDPTPTLGTAWGAFSEYGVVNDYESMAATGGFDLEILGCAKAQTKLPKDFDPAQAVMIITLREVLSSIKIFEIKTQDTVVVFGCGPVGLTFIKLLSLLNVQKIIAIANKDGQLLQAQAMGAHDVLDARAGSLDRDVRKLCPTGIQAVIDAVGKSEIINQAMPMLADKGKICCYGIASNQSAVIDWSEAPYNWQLIYQQFPSKWDEASVHEQIMTWVQDGQIDLDSFISDQIPFAKTKEAFAKLWDKQILKKCVIHFA